jgi:hypothetical protein
MAGEVGLYEEDRVVLFLLVSANTVFRQLSSERFVFILFFYIVVFTVPGAFSQHKSHEANIRLKNEQLKRQTYILQQPKDIPLRICVYGGTTTVNV